MAIKIIEEDDNQVFKPRKKRKLLDDKLADDGNLKTQDQWIKYWCKSSDRLFPSTAQLYSEFKRLIYYPSHLEALRDDMKKTSLLSSTRVRMDHSHGNSRIIHNYLSKKSLSYYVHASFSTLSIMRFFNDFPRYRFLRSLFDTNEVAEDIVSVFEDISGVKRENILVSMNNNEYILPFSGQRDYAVSFGYFPGLDDHFQINLMQLHNKGVSRGIATYK